MNILVIGSGGREHALVWKLKQSPKVKKIFTAPGNAGTQKLGINVPASKTVEIINWLKGSPVDLVVVGPDNYLAEGLTDEIEKLGIKVFGPSKLASKIEWSKSFAKELMKEGGIPTADYEVFSDYKKAVQYLKNKSFPLVIKASGLAFGKGVTIAQNEKDAKQALADMLSGKLFGQAGKEVIIEEYLLGKEISVHAFCDGNDSVLFPPSQDYKKIFDGDLGPNTGGMGTVAPLSSVSEKQMTEIKDKIIEPILKVLKKKDSPFKGILFPGIMITKDGPKVIEFNSRFGDPETQVYMPLLESDLAGILLACVNGNLKKQKIKWSEKCSACVVCASGGYPGNYKIDKPIQGLEGVDDNNKIVVFHAGTKLKNGITVTSGGRVLGITAVGISSKEALDLAYSRVNKIHFEDMQYRKDIGHRAIET